MNIKIDDDNIDVRKIMEQIKANISKRAVRNDDLLNQNITTLYANGNLSKLEGHEYVLNRFWNYSADVPITSHRKFLGKIIVLGKKVVRKLLRWHINPIVNKQVEFNAEVVRSINSLINTIKEMESTMLELKKDKENYKSQIDNLKVSMEERLNDSSNYSEVQEQLQSIQSIQQELEGIIKNNSNQEEQVNSLKHTIQEVRQLVSSQHNETQTAYHAIRVATERLKRIERRMKHEKISFNEVVESPVGNTVNNLESDFDYYLFEEMYRGSRETIKERQKIYLNYFNSNDHVLDLGCGRGEFTELLIENHIKVTAVDINEEMILYCKDRGFPIINSGAIEYLESLEDNSISGVFLGQVIEHLTPEQLIALVNVAYKKLKPTGIFIAETPNPQCLSVFAQSFYMDLTHVKPVHPYTSKFILESAGFRDVEINYISPNDEQLRLPELKLDGITNSSVDQFNKTIEHWNNVIFGYQDYFILGRK